MKGELRRFYRGSCLLKERNLAFSKVVVAITGEYGMFDTTRKEYLLSLIQSEHARLEALLQPLSQQQMLQSGVAGSWSIKDILAHLTWWEQAMISEIVHGIELDPGLQGEPWSTERANALTVEAKRSTPLAAILSEFTNSYSQIVNMLESLEEKDLASAELFEHLANNTGRHYAEHRQMIESWLSL